ncbi:MAG: 50S ribosomal protein L5 [Candidatus Shapirobacteria bacterium]|nr:50S ribosomal protein L5 [Candidatus Shapirobacteria bacterium]
MDNFKDRYQKQVLPALAEELGSVNKMAVPRVVKVIVNMGVAADSNNKEALDRAKESLFLITGQKPKVNQAKKSISGFSLRAGAPIGLSVTLRKKFLSDFLDKLFHLVLPQVKDFKGLSLASFDGRGNYTIGLKENTLFPELDYDKIDRPRGLEITIVTNTDSDDQSRKLLEAMGMPFEKKVSEQKTGF